MEFLIGLMLEIYNFFLILKAMFCQRNRLFLHFQKEQLAKMLAQMLTIHKQKVYKSYCLGILMETMYLHKHIAMLLILLQYHLQLQQGQILFFYLNLSKNQVLWMFLWRKYYILVLFLAIHRTNSRSMQCFIYATGVLPK
jgi:hypothetical protein